MNVCVTVNSKYKRYLYVMLISLYNQHENGSIRLFVIQRDFTDADKNDIRELTEKYGNEVIYIYAHPEKFDNMPKASSGRKDLTLEIYFRLLIPEYLPKDVERVLMLDVDIVVLKDLSELYEIDMGDKYLAAAPNMCHNCQIPEAWRKWYRPGRTNWTHYNTGILLWNIKKIRKDFPKEFIFDQVGKDPIDVATYEEELFNVVFGENRIQEIAADKFNYICTHENNFESPNFRTYFDANDVAKNCSIIHYAGLNPWQSGIKNEKFYIWWDICKESKYYREILEDCYFGSERYLVDYDTQTKKKQKEKEILENTKWSYIDRLTDDKSRTRLLKQLNKFCIKKVIIYGAGHIARLLSNIITEAGVDVLCFTDKNYAGKFQGHDCVAINEIASYEKDADCIIISTPYYMKEIVKDLDFVRDVFIISLDDLLDPKGLWSELSEYSRIFGETVKWAIIGDEKEYKAHISILENFGLHVDKVINVEEIKGTDNEYKYVLLDRDHLVKERKLIAQGRKQNRDYIVITDVFDSAYNYTNYTEMIDEFDRGGYGKNKSEKYGNRFCPIPFTNLFLYDLMAGVCCPPFNNNTNIGNPQELSIEQIWNSGLAQDFRASILDGSYRYCNEDLCWYLLDGSLPLKQNVNDEYLRTIIDNNEVIMPKGPEELRIGYNSACNLYCRMCREKPIGGLDEKRLSIIIDKLKNYDFRSVKRLVLPGSWELFANRDYMDILLNLAEYNLTNVEELWLFSNGLLFNESNWERISGLCGKYKIKITISMDSVRRETFMKIRRGGNWDVFMKNLRMLSQKRKEGLFEKWDLAFCIQRLNFREMSEFVLFADEIGADSVTFEKLFHNPIGECVHRVESVYYPEFLNEFNRTMTIGNGLNVEIEAKPFAKPTK